MNTKAILAVAAFAAFAGTAARADDITIDTTQFHSTKSRAEVQAELAQFKKSGVNPWATNYNPLTAFYSSKSRAQVVGEYLANRDQVAALDSEDSGSAYLTQVGASHDVGTTLAGGQ